MNHSCTTEVTGLFNVWCQNRWRCHKTQTQTMTRLKSDVKWISNMLLKRCLQSIVHCVFSENGVGLRLTKTKTASLLSLMLTPNGQSAIVLNHEEDDRQGGHRTCYWLSSWWVYHPVPSAGANVHSETKCKSPEQRVISWHRVDNLWAQHRGHGGDAH